MPKKSNVTPGPAPSSQKQAQTIRNTIANYFGGQNRKSVDVLREQVIASGETIQTFVLREDGPHTVTRLADESDLQPLKDLLDPLYGKSVTVRLKKHRYFFFIGRIKPPAHKTVAGEDEIEVIIP